MLIQIVGMILAPLVVAGLARWAASRRRNGLAAGRPVHFRARLAGRRGRLLCDPRLGGVPVFLDRGNGKVVEVPRGGRTLEATVAPRSAVNNGVERVTLRYRPPGGMPLSLGLTSYDAATLGDWLSARPASTAPGALARRLPVVPLWAVLALVGAALVALVAADVTLLGHRTAAETVSADRAVGTCVLRWDNGHSDATSCADAGVRPGERMTALILPWPLQTTPVDPAMVAPTAGGVGGGLALLGIGGALVLSPAAAARRVRKVREAGPNLSPEPPPVETDAQADPETDADLPNGVRDTSYGSLAAAARHSERHRPGAPIAPPRARPDRLSGSPRRWVAATLLGTGAWGLLVIAVAAVGDDHFHLGYWRFPVFGTLAIVAAARIGWLVTDRLPLVRPVRRVLRGDAAGPASPQPMRYVRLRGAPGELVLVLFRPEGGAVAAPVLVQPLLWARSGRRRAVGGPVPVGEALVHDSGVGPLVCEIDGVRYLPKGRATVVTADPAQTAANLLALAHSHRRRVTTR
ncbi:hypothetical protein [Streptacidiphilus sp. MAP5-3]|uniref:hypothetical protein n=1 Tax=unclassified Streptacidiphilus TaxID=2643834 RepID=UPI00351789A1